MDTNGENAMNKHFFQLSEEKQQAILQAGFEVFSRNSYHSASMQQAADAAGISKSLLFHYFKNKKEYYLFLWDTCSDITIAWLERWNCYRQKNLFDTLERGLKAKAALIKERPELARFTLRAFYETDPEIRQAIQDSYHEKFNFKQDQALLNLDSQQFREGINIEMMYREMYWASEGYLWEMMQKPDIPLDALEKTFSQLIAFWKKTYLKNSQPAEKSESEGAAVSDPSENG